MDFIDEIDKFVIIVTDYKNSVIKEISDRKKLINYKIFSISEFRKNYYFDYDIKSIYALMNKYNLKYEVASTLIKNMIYLTKEDYKSKKLKELFEMKKYLSDNGYLKYNNIFKSYINSKDIIVLQNGLSKFDKNMFDEVSLSSNLVYKSITNPIYEPRYYELNDIDDEVSFVANKISELINNGINISDIKITNLSNEYINPINRIFRMFNLKVNFDYKTSLFSTNICQLFIKNMTSSKEESLNNIVKYKNSEIYNSIINVLNKFTFESDLLKIKDLVLYEFKNTFIKKERFDNEIEVVDYNNYYFKDSNYVFMMNFNNSSIPVIYKNEDYITDEIKDEVEIDTTNEKNIRSKNTTLDIIKSIKNLCITYKLTSPTDSFYPSMLVSELEECEVKFNKNISYSQDYDKLKLGIYLDDLYKYGTKNENLELMLSNNEIDYNNYDHKYTQIDKFKLNKYLDGKLRLSYSSMNNYNECGFKYYISNILKLDIYEETFGAYVGSIFHKVLQDGLLNEIDVRDHVMNYVKTHDRVLNKKENFYLNNLIKDLEIALNVIKDNMKYTSLDEYMLEKYVEVKKGKTLDVTFNGIIDKVILKRESDRCIMVLIDYKTYDANINLNYLDNGLYMQLPVYLFLASNMGISNIKFGGFYLQKVLNNKVESNTDYLKLYGYSSSNKEILGYFDSNYDSSSMVSGLKTKNDGEFFKNSKVLSEDDMDNIIIKTNDIIDNTIDNIENARFDINPKKIKNDNVSCKFCKYKDICFMNESDVVRIKEKDNDEGGEE